MQRDGMYPPPPGTTPPDRPGLELAGEVVEAGPSDDFHVHSLPELLAPTLANCMLFWRASTRRTACMVVVPSGLAEGTKRVTSS